ncbi:MAG: error-prone DNA polymerase [Pirellulaceae bacterium]
MLRYAELHCKSNFSFLTGASHAEELASRAAELDYAALAVTDRNSLAGIVRAHIAAKEAGLKLIVGAEITLVDSAPVVLWATDRESYARLSRLITVGRRRAAKGECELTFQDLAEHHAGLLAGVCGDAWFSGESNVRAAGPSMLKLTDSLTPLDRYRELFGDRAYLLAELHRGPDDASRLELLRRLSRQTRLPLVAAGDVHYHSPERLPLHDVLTATRLGTNVREVAENRFPNAERHLRTKQEIAAAFRSAPEALARTLEIADRCHFSLDELRYEYPEELAPPGLTPIRHLTELTWRGAERRYPAGVPEKVARAVRHELRLIEELRYEAYFLTVFDMVRFARERGILCQGRGSAANSAVCFCLGVTSVDPDRTDLLFERFVSRERNEAPDIDIDFEHERREEVLQYLYEKYGRERAGMTAVVITYRVRSAVRDVGKALGLSLDRVDRLAKQVEGHHHEPLLPERCRQVGIDPETEIGRRLIYLVNELVGFPRHLSQHVGGMVITHRPLCELAPIENAAMEGRTVIEWDKDDLDELGILKVDCLSLGMLTAIRKCFALVERHHGRRLTLAGVPEGDSAVYDMICRADTMGVFQIESRAQMSMLPRLKPRCFYDLVIEVAIVRPGPIQGQMVHPYLRRRAGEEEESYRTKRFATCCTKRWSADLFKSKRCSWRLWRPASRRAKRTSCGVRWAAWRRPGVIDQFRRKLLEGMQANGCRPSLPSRCFGKSAVSASTDFPNRTRPASRLLVYVSAYLKHYYPAAFAAIINSQPMEFLCRPSWFATLAITASRCGRSM